MIISVTLGQPVATSCLARGRVAEAVCVCLRFSLGGLVAEQGIRIGHLVVVLGLGTLVPYVFSLFLYRLNVRKDGWHHISKHLSPPYGVFDVPTLS